MLPLENLFPYIEQLLKQKERIVVAIDGMSAAGKSSFAKILAEQVSCNLIHMDHFFLRPEQRTPERLIAAGGNIDYERFITEVALPLASGEPFSYKPFDCKTQDFDEPISIELKPLTIIEGVYSMHPEIMKYSAQRRDCCSDAEASGLVPMRAHLSNSSYAEACLYDITIFMQIDEATQKHRLKERNPELYDRFVNEWIPMESKYFEEFDIREKCTYVKKL